MKKQANQFYRQASEMLAAIESGVKNLDDSIAVTESTEELADLEFLLHSLSEQLERVTKEVNQRKAIRIRQICIRWVATSVDGEPVRTDYCVLTPRVVDMPRIPTRSKEMEDGSIDVERYHQFCRELGVTSDNVLHHDLFRPHWPSLAKWIEFLAEQGKPLPDSLKNVQTIPDYRITHRKATKGRTLGDVELD
jgi:hypothetical protein